MIATPPPIATLGVVCWLWADPAYRYGLRYGAEHVNRLSRMVALHLAEPHRFYCVTDMPDGLDRDVEVVPLSRWDDLRDMGGTWMRLKMFSAEARAAFGERILLLDLDAVITGSLDPLLDTDAEFVTCPCTNRGSHYTTGFYLLRAGSRQMCWDGFDRGAAARAVRTDGMWEQGWISHVLGPGERKWGPADGVYAYGADLCRRPVTGVRGALPDDARVVLFHGPHDPSLPETQALSPWIRERWR
ncbi:MAG: hypothetical protein WD270_01745 [Acetobacterales bacterium]